MSTCVVYDDRRPARDLIGRMFAHVPGVHQVVAVASVEELIVRLTGEPGQVAVVGTQRAVPVGTDAIRRVLAVRPGAAVVAVGARDDAPSVRAAVAAGARAFVRWDASRDVVSSLVHAVIGIGSLDPTITMNGRGPAIGARRSTAVRTCAASRPLGDVNMYSEAQVGLGISRREMQVLGGMSKGMSNAEIGRELHLSDNTVKSHARRLFGKLGVHERAHAVARAYRLGLFDSPGPEVGLAQAELPRR